MKIGDIVKITEACLARPVNNHLRGKTFTILSLRDEDTSAAYVKENEGGECFHFFHSVLEPVSEAEIDTLIDDLFDRSEWP